MKESPTLEFATFLDIVTELRRRPNEKWLLFWNNGDDWGVSGNRNTDMREALTVLRHYCREIEDYLDSDGG